MITNGTQKVFPGSKATVEVPAPPPAAAGAAPKAAPKAAGVTP